MAGKLQNGADVSLSKLSPEKLLLRGLQLLSKINASSSVPFQPRLQSKSEVLSPGSPLSSMLLKDPQNTPPSSPEQNQSVPQSQPASGRKRKRRGDNSELSSNERMEKRSANCWCKTQPFESIVCNICEDALLSLFFSGG